MKIKTNYTSCPGFRWEAIDDDSYDGAPDSGRRAHIIGYGRTEAEATENLIELHAELDEEQTEIHEVLS